MVAVVKTPTLDISGEIARRAQVKIATESHPTGEIFELCGELELGLVKIAEVQNMFENLRDIHEKALTDPVMAEQMERWMDHCFDLIFFRPVDEATRKTIPDLRKMQVVQFFLEVCLSPASGQTANRATRRRKPTPTGVK